MGTVRLRHLVILAIPGVIVLLAGCLFFLVVFDPGVPILLSEGRAVWIKPARRVHLEPFSSPQQELFFRTIFENEKPLGRARLTVRALRDSEVTFDGRVILPYSGNFQDWKRPRSVDLAESLSPGQHEIRIKVVNKRGPAIVLAYCSQLGLRTGAGWSVSADGKNWGPVRSVTETDRSPLAEKFGTTFQAFSRLVPFQVLLFTFVLLLFLGLGIRPLYGARFRKAMFTASAFRWLLIAAWVILAANNITRIALYQGFDVVPHYDYISFVAETWHTPLPSDGWQMFQSPFYYFLSAVLFKLLSPFCSLKTAALALRIIPLLCGILEVEICYRALRYVYAQRSDLQILGTLIGGLMPMNLYISQCVGNEPLAGVLTSLTLLICFHLITRDRIAVPGRYPVILGILSGFAILTKMSAGLLLLPLLMLLIYVGQRQGWRLRQTGSALLVFAGSIGLIAGWYHIRNWIVVGRPFVGGWDPIRGIAWWQEPGYRTPAHFAAFGESLVHPIYSALSGFWDSIYSTLWADGLLSSKIVYEYRPPWNYGFMFCAVLFALLPALAILLGLLGTVLKPGQSLRDGRLFAGCCILVYFSAMIYLFATVPIYSTAKATYTLGLLPCYAIMAAGGLNWLMRGLLPGALVKTLIVCWAVNSYLAFFVV